LILLASVFIIPPALFGAAPARYKMCNLESKARCMNWEALGALGEIAGAMAVIVTLIYLSVQIRQNTKASRIAAVQAASENSSRFSELIAADPVLGEVFWRGLVDPGGLDPGQERQFLSVLNVFIRREAVSYYLHKEGIMPDELWAGRVASLKGTVNQPGMQLYLRAVGDTLPADFRAFLLQAVSQPSTLSEEARRVFGNLVKDQPKA
jgi:hypothetical protein